MGSYQATQPDASFSCRRIVQVDALQHAGSCQFEPEALVSAIRCIVEEHTAYHDDSIHAQGNGRLLHDSLHSEVHSAPPIGFHDL